MFFLLLWFCCCCCCDFVVAVVVVVIVAHVVVVVIVFVDPGILPLRFGQNRVIDRWDLVVDIVVLLLIPKT